MNDMPGSGGDELRDAMPHSDAEFEAFLGSLGWGASHSHHRRTPHTHGATEPPAPIVPAACPPEANAVLPSPAVSRGSWALVAMVVLIVALGVAWRPLASLAAKSWAQFTGPSIQELLAADLLSDSLFRSLQPGTSAEEVRNRVGLPGTRGTMSPTESLQNWYYAIKPLGRNGQSRFYVVTLSDGRVTRAVDITAFRSQFRMPNFQATAPMFLGGLSVESKGSTPQVLHAAGETATLLVGPSANARIPSDFAIRALRHDRVVSTRTGAPVELPPLALYWRGVLLALPLPGEGIPIEVLTDDLKWLFNRLGCDETGTAIARGKSGLTGPQ